MNQEIKHKNFIRKFNERNIQKEGIRIKGFYQCSKCPILISTPYGDCLVSPSNILHPTRIKRHSIKTAINKSKYFINLVKEKFPETPYDYSLVDYKHSTAKIKIICPVHGIFDQTPQSHMIGKGCAKCARAKTASNNRLKRKEILSRFLQVHKNTYDYSLVDFNSSSRNIDIICKKHGKFNQSLYTHLNGRGCPVCGRHSRKKTKRKKGIFPGWRYSTWERAAKVSKNFDSYKVYLIKCWNEETGEEFYKIGRTFKKVSKRFSSKKDIPYNYKLLNIKEFNDAQECCVFERRAQNIFKKYSYIPKKPFRGMYECFSK